LNVNLKELPKSSVELTFDLTPEDLKPYVEKASRNLSKEVKIKGFRTGGKIPQDVLERHLGPQQLFKEAVDIAVKENFVKALLDNNLETISQPEINLLKASPGDNLVFTVTVVVLPKVSMADYRKIKIVTDKVEISDKEIDTAISTLRKSRASYANVVRPAQKGDRVEVNFDVFLRGVAIEGGSSKQHPLILGEGHFMKGFEDNIIGMKEGEKKSFSLKTPKDYWNKKIAGKEVEFKVHLGIVQNVSMPELDSEFAKKLGKFASMADLKKSIGQGLLEEKKAKQKEKERLKIVDFLLAGSTMEIPDQLIDSELEKMDREFNLSINQMNLDRQSYLSHIKKSESELKSNWQEQAQKRVRAALVLKEVAKLENIVVESEEIDQRIGEFLKNVPSPDAMKNINVGELKKYIGSVIRNEKVFEFLENNVINT